ncbi:TetR/AcrR family transcriptional regulator C-terminal domain-containing protein [Dactylosporangium sp. CA-139066]|uniref:TetR/AcrR family transcriptional regulator C-terminal domain-containing protein n=1 Tax=Dactylosporangium sp. CA-139066 TaxID=3239930 RepID=UPI003D8FDB3F
MPYTPIWNLPSPPPRQRLLGREEIVGAAIAVADEAGAQGLTMKAVAARLGSYSPMALYRYVHSKDGLVDLMLDAVTAEVPIPSGPGPDWRADLRVLAAGTREMAKRHGWFADLVHTRPPAGPHQMRRTEFMLAVLAGQGASVTEALTYAALLDRHVFGSAQQEQVETRFEREHGLQSPAALMAALEPIHGLAAADGRLPLLTSWLARPGGPTPDERFDLGLRFLLDGIAGELVGRAQPSSR